MDDIKLKLAEVKASTQKSVSENAFSAEKLTGFPQAWLDLINENILDKDKAREVLEVVKKIYDSNIKDQEDEVKRNVAIQALRNTLESKKENFTHDDFHTEFDKLYRSGLPIGTDVDLTDVDSKAKDVDPGLAPSCVDKCEEPGIDLYIYTPRK